MTTRPYELLARFDNKGNVVGVSVKSIETIAGKEYELDPEPLSGTSDPAFTQFAELFSASIVAERDNLLADAATLAKSKAELDETINLVTAERDDLTAKISQSTIDHQAAIDELQAELDAIKNPPGPDLSTVQGVRDYLATSRYNRETDGFHVGDQFISTNRDELAHWFARFFDAYNALTTGTSDGKVYPYKPKGGSEVAKLSAEQSVRVYQCLAWYVNACIATEGGLIDLIELGTRLDLVVDAINNPSTWPQTQFSWIPPA